MDSSNDRSLHAVEAYSVRRKGKAQRIVLIAGATGILHSSMVPPVTQGEEPVCRYHAFLERQWLFTRGYDVPGADLVALFSEYGAIVGIAALAYLLLGLLTKG